MHLEDKSTINLMVAVHEDELAARWQHDDIAVEVPMALTITTFHMR